MSLQKISVLLTKTIAFVLSVFLFLSTMPALAASMGPRVITAEIGSDGQFSINIPMTMPVDKVIRSAVLDLQSSGSGIIESIQIKDNNPPESNPSGLIFGCVNLRVKDKTNLIKSCGGPAKLQSSTKYSYVANGSGFKPNTKFTISLYDQFNEGEG